MRRRHQRLDFSGSIHFVTTVTRHRGNWFTDASVCQRILFLFERYRKEHHLTCFGYVLMPDHLHTILQQMEDGPITSNWAADFKRETSLGISINNYDGRTLWRDRYDDVPIPGYDAARTRLEYMLSNPIRRGLCDRSEDYLWSSAGEHFGLRQGLVEVTPI